MEKYEEEKSMMRKENLDVLFALNFPFTVSIDGCIHDQLQQTKHFNKKKQKTCNFLSKAEAYMMARVSDSYKFDFNVQGRTI